MRRRCHSLGVAALREPLSVWGSGVVGFPPRTRNAYLLRGFPSPSKHALFRRCYSHGGPKSQHQRPGTESVLLRKAKLSEKSGGRSVKEGNRVSGTLLAKGLEER